MMLRGFGRRATEVGFWLLIASSACKKREVATRATPLPAPARPSEVLAELCVPRPTELWPALQALLGPPITFLPKAPELGLGGWLALSPLVASSLDLRAPLVAVALGGAEPGFLLGVHLESGAEFVAQLTTGNAPSHRLERVRGLSLLTAVKTDGAASLAVVGNALVIGPRRSAVLSAGPYVARSLLPQANAKGPVTALLPGEALRAVGVPALRGLWEKNRAGLLDAQRRAEVEHGRPADFAEPSVILAGLDRLLESVLSVLSSTERVGAELQLDEQSLEIVARFWPLPSGVAQQLAHSLPVGASDALKALPATTVLGILAWRAPDPEAHELSGAVRALLGPRLSESDDRALREALTALDSGRGNVQALGLLADLSLVWRGEVADAALMRQGLERALPLFTKKPLADPIAALFGRPSLTRGSVRIEGAEGPVQRAVFRLSAPQPVGGKPIAARQLELLSLVESRRFVLAAASGSGAPLTAALAAERGEASLGAQEQAARLLDRAERVAWLVFADLGQLAAAEGEAPAASAPVLFDLAARDGVAELAVRASRPALRALLARELRP